MLIKIKHRAEDPELRQISSDIARGIVRHGALNELQSSLAKGAFDSLEKMDIELGCIKSVFPYKEQSHVTTSTSLKFTEVSEVLDLFNVGKLIGFERPERDHGDQRVYMITTDENKTYVLKQFSNFDDLRRSSLFLQDFLHSVCYPVPKVIQTKSGELYTIHEGVAFALFEKVDFNPKRVLTEEEAYSLGRTLARLHTLANDFPITQNYRSIDFFERLFNENYERGKDASKEIRDVLPLLKEMLPAIRVPDEVGAQKTVCHVEMRSKHVSYKNGNVSYIIDWDFAQYDYAHYDRGTTFASAFEISESDGVYAAKLNIRNLARMIQGYSETNKTPASAWEKDHVFESVLYGAFKYAAWGMPAKVEDWNYLFFQMCSDLLKMGKEEFNKSLNIELEKMKKEKM